MISVYELVKGRAVFKAKFSNGFEAGRYTDKLNADFPEQTFITKEGSRTWFKGPYENRAIALFNGRGCGTYRAIR